MKNIIFYCSLFLTFCLFVSCHDKIEAVCTGDPFTDQAANDNLGQSEFRIWDTPLLENIIYYEYFDDRVRFWTAKTVSHICPLTPVKINLNTKTTSADQIKPFTLIGEGQWDTFVSSSGNTVFFSIDSTLSNHIYNFEFEIDLNNNFTNQETEVQIGVAIQFSKFNSFSEDSLYFVNHFESFQIEIEGRLFQ
ncbi:MAG TPA: hypothetical protein VFG10_12495 [Saprospiraceae bacterium]|nr:hypothetical protein [Saprospiraceae bacterium]